MAFVTALMNSLITILLSYTSGGGRCVWMVVHACACVCVVFVGIILWRTHTDSYSQLSVFVSRKLMAAEEKDGWSSVPTLISHPPALCLCFSICSRQPALCFFSLLSLHHCVFLNTCITSTSSSSSDPLLPHSFVQYVFFFVALMSSFSPLLFISVSVPFLLTGLSRLLRTGLAYCSLCVCMCVWLCQHVCVSIRACVGFW